MTTLTDCRNISIAIAGLLMGGCAVDLLGEHVHALSASTTVSTGAGTYNTGQDILVSYSGMLGDSSDWISLATPNANDDIYVAWRFTDGASDGILTFVAPQLPAGEYEVRAHFAWTATQTYEVQARSTTFTVAEPTTPLATSKATYAAGEAVQLLYSGLPGTTTDWIAIAAPGSPLSSFIRYSYTGGAPSGQVSIANVPNGTYVARSFGEDSYSLISETPTFVVGDVAPVPASVTTASAYLIGENIVVNYAGMQGSPDWIAIAPAGAPLETYGEWQYVTGPAGQAMFAPLAAGTWEVRAFYNDALNLADSMTFNVDGSAIPTVSTNAVLYTVDEDVSVTYNRLPGNQTDWIAISIAGSPADSYLQWSYTAGATTGTKTFTNLLAGNYVARAYVNDSYAIVAETAFTVGEPSVEVLGVSTVATFTTADAVEVDYSGLEGNQLDWIGIAPAGSDDAVFIAFVYTQGNTSGTATFAALPVGDYEARAYFNDTYVVAARTMFSVVEPAP